MCVCVYRALSLLSCVCVFTEPCLCFLCYHVCVCLQSSHLALIDAMMTAYVADIVTVERVVKAVRSVSITHSNTANSINLGFIKLKKTGFPDPCPAALMCVVYMGTYKDLIDINVFVIMSELITDMKCKA